jgi:hypothetical protein
MPPRSLMVLEWSALKFDPSQTMKPGCFCRPSGAIALRRFIQSPILDIFGTTPSTDLAYDWLREDLRSISWIR